MFDIKVGDKGEILLFGRFDASQAELLHNLHQKEYV